MRKYWTCSRFADWLRGTPKPKWGTGDEWKDWKIEAKSKHPWRWWLAEEGLNHIQDFIYYIPEKLSNARYYINNRFITRSHSLTAHPNDIAPGDWCNVGDRFLPCLFNELVDFIEVEKAWMQVVFNEENRKKYNVPKYRLLGWRGWRCAEAGLDYLEWEMNLTYGEESFLEPDDPRNGTLTPEAITAREQYVLYKWWTETRPSRIDPYVISGWNDYCDSKTARGIGMFETDPEDDGSLIREMLKKIQEVEETYFKKDEEMLIRLIKIRRSLWT